MKAELADMEYAELVKSLDQLKQDKAAAGGALAEQMKTLRKEFGCKTIEEAKAKLERLAKRKRRLGIKAKLAYDRLMKKYGGRINGGEK